MTSPDEPEGPDSAPAEETTAEPAVETPPAPSQELSGRRFVLLYAAPLFLLLLWAVLPLVRGTETLLLRDVLNTHFPMKQAQAMAMRAGYFPLIDPYRAGGQPLAGNPNAVPFYPTNLLFLIGSTFWALNAQFWIHLLLAPLAFFWLARSWGLARAPAWAAAVCYTVSGFFLSHLSFYNLIAAAALAPALVAACLDLAAGRRRTLTPPAIALLWALLLLGGDPLMAALASGLAGTALLTVWGAAWRRRGERPGWRAVGLLAAAFATGTLLALPQLVEFLRILPMSFRGHWGYSQAIATVASFDPRQTLEWLLPFAFGRPDLLSHGSFWGSRFYTDTPPYYLSLYPGLLTFALIAAGGRPRPPHRAAAWWSWACVAGGLFFSLGRFNPLVSWMFGGQGSLRYPVKLWLPVAVGGALLCGLGFERLFVAADTAARHRFALTLGGLAAVLGGFWIFLSFASGRAAAMLRQLIPDTFNASFVANERLRWAGLCLMSLALVAALALIVRLGRRRPVAAGALLLAVHAWSQLLLLRPLYPMDAVTPYLVPPPALASVPSGVRVVNPDFNYLFGPSSLKQGRFPKPTAAWMERRAFYELYPFTGALWQRRYDLNESAEGLDSFLSRMGQGSVKGADNEGRLRLLAAWGVGRLVMNHPLSPQPERAKLLANYPSFHRTLYIYEVLGRAPEAFLARRVFFAPHLNAAKSWLLDPRFDPRLDAVIPGKDRAPVLRSAGSVRVVKEGPERLEVDVDAGPGGSVLVVQRSWGLFQARLDGRKVPVLSANLQRMGVEVPAGRHRVVFRVDRTAFTRSFLAVALGLALLPVLAAWGRGKRQPVTAAQEPSPPAPLPASLPPTRERGDKQSKDSQL